MGMRSGLADIRVVPAEDRNKRQILIQPIAWALMLLLLMVLSDARPRRAEAELRHALKAFHDGEFEKSQREAEQGARRWSDGNPAISSEFQLLEAKSMVFRGMSEDALRLLSSYRSAPDNPDGAIQRLALEAIVLAHQQKFSLALQALSSTRQLCRGSVLEACGEVLRARGILAGMQGEPEAARQYYIETLAFTRAHHDKWSEAGTLINLGFAAMQLEHYDEALDWLRSAQQAAVEIGDKNTGQKAAGNLGWAYSQLGDYERALDQFWQAENIARSIGNVSSQLGWMNAAGYVYQLTGDLSRAIESYRRALELANSIENREDIEQALEELAQVSVDARDLKEATIYLDRVTPMELADTNRLSANVILTEGMLAAARQQDQLAEPLFRRVQLDPKNPTTVRLAAGEQLAHLFESQGKTQLAEQMYKATLTDFESARAQLKSEETKLPFVANAERIYDGYIALLVKHGRSDEALAIADQSRARTLTQFLGGAKGKAVARPTTPDPRWIARKVNATLLFYWLGLRQSYLWAITPEKIVCLLLPPQEEIDSRIERYIKTMPNLPDPLEADNRDGQTLYKLLVAPASNLIRPKLPVMILADGTLSKLNFETLLVPGPGKDDREISHQTRNMHYWIDDATLLSAPSLSMLAESRPVRNADPSLLLLGNPVSRSEDFPTLPLFGFEMKKVQDHFDPQRVTVFSGSQATPEAYLSSNPKKYSYVHFVSHAVASRTDPLDSAIILSSPKDGDDSFKLYARDIMQHPIDARLVTISACYGSGTRSYAGEGLVGLSWAFLRAGAHSVIGALWEVSDDSTPRLMDALYQGLADGKQPATALRKAKLTLLHSNSKFESPFYWAPFQIYTR